MALTQILWGRIGMKGVVCPNCGCRRMPAQSTRHSGAETIRVRRCSQCSARVRTVERIAGKTNSGRPKVQGV